MGVIVRKFMIKCQILLNFQGTVDVNWTIVLNYFIKHIVAE